MARLLLTGRPGEPLPSILSPLFASSSLQPAQHLPRAPCSVRPSLGDDFSSGFTIGAGVEVRALLLRVTQEIRYTRWGTQHFNSVISNGNLRSNLNRAEFLVGFTF